MKVSKTGASSAPGKSKKAAKSGGGDSSFADALKGTSETESAKAASGAVGVNSVDAILALQGAADATDHRSRGLMMEYGTELLDRLDQVRLAILNGSISKDRLHELARRLRERSAESDDPRLNDLISDIELRVEIELAKLSPRNR